MLGHPAAGRCRGKYIVLTDGPERLGGLGLKEEERFGSRYEW